MNRAIRAVVLLSVPVIACLIAAPGIAALRAQAAPPAALRQRSPLVLPQEKHLANIKQLTDDAENAEAYFSFDGQRLSFQSTRVHGCDQIYTMNIDGSDLRRISNGEGRTTCSFYYPDGKHILYASTHLAGAACPATPDQSLGYVWPVYDAYDIFRADADGKNLVQLTKTPGYDAEATIAKDGRVVFTSVRDGDMEIYSMTGDGSDVRRLTNLPGPDGGPFFSPDGTKIVFRGHHPDKGAELDDYFALLKKALWRPGALDVFVMDRDGKNLKQITHGGGANWAPYWTPDGQRIIYASNARDPQGRNFDIFLINLDGTGLEQITFNDTFDGFPMFSPDGKQLVFASNRHDAKDGETNIFIADWVK
jgi:Tol biopolymer transport system component